MNETIYKRINKLGFVRDVLRSRLNHARAEGKDEGYFDTVIYGPDIKDAIFLLSEYRNVLIESLKDGQ